MSITRTDGASGAYFEVSATGVLTISDGTNTVTLTPSTGLTTAAGATVFADLSAMATGTGKINIRDNVAAAFVLAQGANAYLTARTTDGAETLLLGRSITFTVMSITMAATPHSLVYGTAGSDQTSVVGNLMLVDPGAASRVLRLPPTAGSSGLMLFVMNVSNDAFEIATSTGTTVVAAVAAGRGAIVGSNGSGWGHILSA
mgnify:CR=1 FL=1